MTHTSNRPQRTISRAIAGLIPGAQLGSLTVTVRERLPLGSSVSMNPSSWTGTAEGLADRIHRALFGIPRQADPVDETSRQLDDYADLIGQPWYPPLDGDLVHVHYEATETARPWGETYAVETTEPEPGLPEGGHRLRIIHCTTYVPTDAGMFAPGPRTEPLMELWTEARPHRITVVRDGVTVHDGPNWRR